jgi:8-oxo-dGTP pyrophosphatase MutT (NUDIX family)
MGIGQLHRFSDMANGTNHVLQAGAIPLRGGRICLVTSSNGKRWVIPKGLIEPGQSPGEAALQEAWEEAGLVGTLRPEPAGTFLYDKWCGTCHVTVFIMEVSEVALDWPEHRLRRREWVTLAGALERLDDEGLCDILRLTLGKKHTVPLNS